MESSREVVFNPSYTYFLFARTEYFTKKLVRSSGPGGQNVNKVATKVEIRFNVKDAVKWLDKDVLERFTQKEKNRINKSDEFAIASDKTRHAVSPFWILSIACRLFWESNEEDCYNKLKLILKECARQVELENRQPTEEDLKILDER